MFCQMQKKVSIYFCFFYYTASAYPSKFYSLSLLIPVLDLLLRKTGIS